MEKILELFALFVLALLGFVIPILGITLSIFAKGLNKLAQQYETERTQTEERLKNQLKGIGNAESMDISAIKKTIRELQIVKKTAESKLQLLSPKKALAFVCIPLTIAYLLMLPTFINSLPLSLKYFFSLASLILTIGSLYQLWRIFDILVETMKILEYDNINEHRKVTELLSEIVLNTKEGSSYFIQKVFVVFNALKLKDDVNTFTLQVQREAKVTISLLNSEALMAKDVEAGICFTADFLIEKSSGYSIYTTGSDQIVRYSVERIHGNTNCRMLPLTLTPLKKGEYNLQTFIKGENIKSKYRILKIIAE